MTYQSQRIAYAYFLVAVLLFGLQVAFGFVSLAKYLGPDPLSIVFAAGVIAFIWDFAKAGLPRATVSKA